MLKTVSGVMAAGVLALTGFAAQADDFNRSVAAGKRTLIGSFALYDSETCYSGSIPEAKVATAPEHGKLEFVVEQFTGGTGTQCGAMRFYARRVYYTPKAGFRGTDSASVDFFYNYFVDAPRPTSRRQSYTITVK